MKLSSFLSVLCLAGMVAGCKQSGESATSAASRSDQAPAVEMCQLSSAQVKLLSTADEYKTLEKVEFSTLSAAEKDALSQKKTSSSCSAAEMSALAQSFPSVAAKLSTPSQDDSSATALALGGVGEVVRTDYIIMPRTGTRYIAGYNSEGIIVTLMRLMQHRPR